VWEPPKGPLLYYARTTTRQAVVYWHFCRVGYSVALGAAMKPAAGLGLNQNGRVVTALFVTAGAVPAPLGDNLISVGSRR